MLMTTDRLAALRRLAWMLPSLAVPVVVGAVIPQIGLVLGAIYAVLNTAGYWLFISGRVSTDRLARWSRSAAMVALPLGFVLVLFSEGAEITDSIDPKDRSAALAVKPHLL